MEFIGAVRNQAGTTLECQGCCNGANCVPASPANIHAEHFREYLECRTHISTANNQAGTPTYMAPEMFEGKRITESVDIYSFGILLWECYTGELWRHRSGMRSMLRSVVAVSHEI